MERERKSSLVDPRLFNNKDFKRHQIKVFLITVLLYCTWHAARTVWAYSKKAVKDSDPYFTDSKLGLFDMLFMLAYASGLFLNGWLGDQSNLKVFVAVGSAISLSGYMTFALLARNEIFSMAIFSLCFILHGFGQSRGFPGNIAILGNWIEPSKRGFLLGLWNASVDVGNILGQQIGRLIIDVYGLHWSNAIFIVGAMMVFMSLIMLIFLQVDPKQAGLLDDEIIALNEARDPSTMANLENQNRRRSSFTSRSDQVETKGISFWEAWRTPGVIKYSLVFVCIKGSTYGLLFWLPDYLQTIMNYGDKTAFITAMYEVGQFIGAVALGHISDRVGKRSTVIVVALYVSALSFIVLALLGPGVPLLTFASTLFISGIFFGGPEVIIGGVVSSDIGEDTSVKRDVRSLSTMAGIVDGSGSIGAAAIQLIIPAFKTSSFYIYFTLCVIAALCLTPTVIKEFQHKRALKKLSLEEFELKERESYRIPLAKQPEIL